MYESAAYDNHHGDPVVVLVTTGTHDVSRLINLLTGKMAGHPVCEQIGVGQRILRQVRRHTGGRGALRLLAAHGGPDLLHEPDPLVDERDRLRAEVEKLRAQLDQAEDHDRDVQDDLGRVTAALDALRGRIGVDAIARAIGDPGSVVGRKRGPSWGQGADGYADREETVTRWSTRAVLAVLGYTTPRSVVIADVSGGPL